MSDNSTSSGSPSLTAKKNQQDLLHDSQKVDNDGEGNTPQINDSWNTSQNMYATGPFLFWVFVKAPVIFYRGGGVRG